MKVTWDKWLRENAKDPRTQALLPGCAVRCRACPACKQCLGMLTEQDARALAAISRCWELYALSDAAGARAALAAIRALLPALQPQCRVFARELIAMSLDWDDRAKLWPLVATEGEFP
jgi:hypothetical protein